MAVVQPSRSGVCRHLQVLRVLLPLRLQGSPAGTAAARHRPLHSDATPGPLRSGGLPARSVLLSRSGLEEHAAEFGEQAVDFVFLDLSLLCLRGLTRRGARAPRSVE